MCSRDKDGAPCLKGKILDCSAQDKTLLCLEHCLQEETVKNRFRQSAMNKPLGQSKDGIAALVALLCSLILASQLMYHLMNLQSTFYYRGRQILAQILTSSKRIGRIGTRRQWRPRRFWVRPGRTCIWWDNFLDDVMPEEWKENFRMCKENFLKLRSELLVCAWGYCHLQDFFLFFL